MLDFLLGLLADTLPWFLVPVLAFFLTAIFFRETYRAELEQKHFGRGRFAAWVDSDGKLHIEGDPPRDHAQRCQDYFREKKMMKPKLVFFGVLFIECLVGLIF